MFFVGHMASWINVDTVIGLVSNDARSAIQRLMTDTPQPSPPPDAFWHNAVPIIDVRRGYLQQLNDTGLADWAATQYGHPPARPPGDYVFPGAPIAIMTRRSKDDAAIRNATALGGSGGVSATSNLRCASWLKWRCGRCRRHQ